jgi:putative flippase GtrA
MASSDWLHSRFLAEKCKLHAMATFSSTSTNKEIQLISRFLTVGAVGTVLDFSLLTLLKMSGLPTIFANSVSFTAGLLNNFTWNRLWTFKDGIQTGWHKQFVQFTLISLFGLALNNIIVISLEGVLGNVFGHPEWGYIPAKFIATGVVVFWNYFANRMWTFNN